MSRYGYKENGDLIKKPRPAKFPLSDNNNWELIPEGEVIPQYHRVYHETYSSRGNIWIGCWTEEKRCRSTMTPVRAVVWGSARAYAKRIGDKNE